jgi:hypothetical protein
MELVPEVIGEACVVPELSPLISRPKILGDFVTYTAGVEVGFLVSLGKRFKTFP